MSKITYSDIEIKFKEFETKFKDRIWKADNICSDLIGYSFYLKDNSNDSLKKYYLDFFASNFFSIEICLQYYSLKTYDYHLITKNRYNWEEINKDLFLKYLGKFEMYLLME